MSADNRKNIEEIKAEYVDGLKFHFVTSVHEVTDIAWHEHKKVENLLLGLPAVGAFCRDGILL